ncbi:hypothetical protein [Actinomycetospora lemnae]|uniref:Uncharacterized protein n=1 Tax=Actinomycetospora lemnae TaxID=3019891 RepID=A0ABT5SX48_9PSEU|nr:hypothetical protein [Actinomycetospora sp. DW7H6]MDD7966572.1 hypothetical protein [Actinomycetospora sp. DW7H6]
MIASEVVLAKLRDQEFLALSLEPPPGASAGASADEILHGCLKSGARYDEQLAWGHRYPPVAA